MLLLRSFLRIAGFCSGTMMPKEWDDEWSDARDDAHWTERL